MKRKTQPGNIINRLNITAATNKHKITQNIADYKFLTEYIVETGGKTDVYCNLIKNVSNNKIKKAVP